MLAKFEIPQGCVLGTLLFLLFINDMPDGIMSSVMIYADITEGCGLTVCLVSQVAIKKFNATQLTDMTYENTTTIRSQMKEGDGKLTDIIHDDEVGKCRGVLFDRKVSFRQHIVSIVKKVNRMIGLTRRTFHDMDEEVFRLLYISLMRPFTPLSPSIFTPHQILYSAPLSDFFTLNTREPVAME